MGKKALLANGFTTRAGQHSSCGPREHREDSATLEEPLHASSMEIGLVFAYGRA